LRGTPSDRPSTDLFLSPARRTREIEQEIKEQTEKRLASPALRLSIIRRRAHTAKTSVQESRNKLLEKPSRLCNERPRGVGFQPALSYEMHIYSVHNRARTIFSLSIARLAATLVLSVTCARTIGAEAEATRRASFFERSENANHNLLPDQYLASKKPARISDNLRIAMR
jgi:hypothetical protein